MTNEEVIAIRIELLAERFSQVDGAVLSAGASNGNRQVASIFRGKTRRPARHELNHVMKKLLNFGNGVKECLHVRVEAGLSPQRGLPMGIWKTAGIEDEVGVKGDAVLETKGNTGDRHPVITLRAHPISDEIPQLMNVGMAGIDDQVGPARDRDQQALLPVDGFG